MPVESYYMVAGSCAAVLGVMLLKSHARFLLHFLVRTVLGAAAILCVNEMLQAQGVAVSVGINPMTLLTSGSLGFGGVLLLYGILFLKFL